MGLSQANLDSHLDFNADQVNTPNWMKLTPVMIAAATSNPAAISSLVSYKADVNLRDSEQRTALHYAASVGSIECIRLLLEAGADHSLRDHKGMVALHDLMATDHGRERTEQMIDAFLEFGADLEARDLVLRTPLHAAVEWKNPSAVKILIERGADIDSMNEDERTPIVRAIELHNYEVLCTLIDLGAKFAWKTVRSTQDNVFKCVVYQGTVNSMYVLASSKAPPVQYSRREIMSWFNHYRVREEIYHVAGEEIPAPEEELRALNYMLERGGIDVDVERYESDQQCIYESGADDTNNTKDDEYHDMEETSKPLVALAKNKDA